MEEYNQIGWVRKEVQKYRDSDHPVRTILQVKIRELVTDAQVDENPKNIMENLSNDLKEVTIGSTHIQFYHYPDNYTFFLSRNRHNNILKARVMKIFFERFNNHLKYHDVYYMMSEPIDYLAE